jgi:hypothetical protein
MELAIDIIKNILLPKLEKDANFDSNKTDAAFWESFAMALLDFEKDDTTCKTVIYNLELNNPERIISKLPNSYNLFINELAENHVLGNESEAIDSLLKSKNQLFNEEVRFLSNLEEAIIDIERDRIKAILSKTNESLVEELNKKETKVISLSWIKYAAAACVVLATGIMYYKFNTSNNLVQPVDNTVVTAPVKKDTVSKDTIIPELPNEALAKVDIVTKTYPVMESGLGMATNTIKIVENNQNARKVSIIKAIENYQKLLENEFSENKVGVNARVKVLETKRNSLQKELALLKEREKQYVFDGKALVLYVSNTAKENTIVIYEETYYLKKDADYFKLTVATAPQLYKKISETNLINNLDDILSENGK